MLTKPSPAALRALHAFGGQTGWTEVSKFLESELAATYHLLTEATDIVTLRQAQGRAKFINEFLRTVRDAPGLLEKLRVSTL